MNRFFVLFYLLFLFISLNSQTIHYQKEKWMDVLVDVVSDENYEQNINIVIERLSEIINNPILLNICTKEQLEQIPFLSEQQIENLLYYLYVYGEMKTIHELRMVEGFDLATIELVSPFFRVEPVVGSQSKGNNNLFKYARHSFLIRFDRSLNRKEGYADKTDSILSLNPNKKYLGSPEYYSLRYKLESGDKLKIGFVLEKDPGEKSIDYWNGYLQLKNRGVLKNFVAGAFKLRIGSGLVLNNAFSLGKNNMGAGLLSRSSGISPHASVDEYNYHQGIAAEINAGRFSFIPFWSYRSLDARIAADTILSVKKDGLHNLLREKEKKNQADLILTGMHTSYRGAFYELGITGCYMTLDKHYSETPTLYNRFYFRGKKNFNLSANYRLRYAGISFSGETAVSKSKGIATLNALTFAPASDWSVMFIQRYYGKSYHSWYGNSFAEGSGLNNESGFSLYFNYKPIAYLTLSGGVDFFRFPWAKYGIDIPSSGYEISFQSVYQQQERIAFTVRYRLKNKDKNRTGIPDSIPPVWSYQQHKLNLRLYSRIGEYFFLNSSVESVFSKFEKEKASSGYLLSQGIGFKSSNIPVQADLLIGLFDTDNTTTRVYLSEKNVLYGFGIPSFYGNGMRVSFNLRYDYSSFICCWFKIGNTRYFDREEIGSGLELIRGKNKTDLQVQIQVKF
ncbi:MAG: hypothetical protein ACRCSQ_10535 [Bacteroidales bacterium]